MSFEEQLIQITVSYGMILLILFMLDIIIQIALNKIEYDELKRM